MIEMLDLIGKNGMRVLSFGYLFANTNKHGSCSLSRCAVRMRFEQVRKAGSEQQIVDRRQQPVEIARFATVARWFDTLHWPIAIYRWEFAALV